MRRHSGTAPVEISGDTGSFRETSGSLEMSFRFATLFSERGAD